MTAFRSWMLLQSIIYLFLTRIYYVNLQIFSLIKWRKKKLILTNFQSVIVVIIALQLGLQLGW